MKSFRGIVLLIGVALFLSACWEDKSFYVKEAELSIVIERLGIERFRIFIYRNDTDRGKDYVDIDYDMSEMPAIRLCISKNENSKIFVIDTRHSVERINSSEFVFDVLSPKGAKNGEMITLDELDCLNATLAKIDSVRDSIPSITIQLNSRLTDLSVWENGKYEGLVRISPDGQ